MKKKIAWSKTWKPQRCILYVLQYGWWKRTCAASSCMAAGIMCAGRFGINDIDERGIERRDDGNNAEDGNLVVAIADVPPAIDLCVEGKRDAEVRLTDTNLLAGRGNALVGNAG